MQVLPLQLNLYNMKKLLLLLLLTPFFSNAQVVNTILRKNTATKVISSYSSGSAGTDTLANVYKLTTFTEGQVPAWDATNKRFKASTVSLSGIKTFVFSRDASDISGYEQAVALNSYVEGLRDTATITATTSGILMQEFATNIGFPNMTVIQPGEFRVYYETKKASGGQNYWTYAVVLKRSLAGTETVIDTTEISTVTDANTLQNVNVSFLVASNISLLTTDRLVVKVYAQMQSSTASIDLYYDDATYARLTIPSSSVDATNFVPYVGATKDLDMGAFDVTADSLNGNGLGITDVVHLTGNQTITGVKTFNNVTNFTGIANTKGYNQTGSFTNSFTGNVTFNNSNPILYSLGLNFYNSVSTNTSSLISNAIGTRDWRLPDASGTLVLTSDLGSYLTLSGGTLTGALNGTNASFTITSGSAVLGTATTGVGGRFINNSATNPSLFVTNIGAASIATFDNGSGASVSITQPGGISGNNFSISSSGAYIGSTGVFSSFIRSNTPQNNTPTIAFNNSNYEYIGSGTFYGFRQATDNSFNIDMYNSGTPINAFKITQTGAATFSGNISAANLTSGTYTPTLTNGANVASSTAYNAQYIRVGNVVTVWGTMNIDAISDTTPTVIGISVPIASNFANITDLNGYCNPSLANGADNARAQVYANTSSDYAEFSFTSPSASDFKYSFSFTYEIL